MPAAINTLMQVKVPGQLPPCSPLCGLRETTREAGVDHEQWEALGQESFQLGPFQNIGCQLMVRQGLLSDQLQTYHIIALRKSACVIQVVWSLGVKVLGVRCRVGGHFMSGVSLAAAELILTVVVRVRCFFAAGE
jgi:hypothetical protein